MSITTRKGDRGRTSLCGGKIVRKDDLRIEAYGALDELCSFLGLVKSLAGNGKTKGLLEAIQKDLFVMGAEIAAQPKNAGGLKKRIDGNYVKQLEAHINNLENKIKLEGRCFLLPGENLIAALLDVTRTVARRAERLAVTLRHKNIFKNPHILIYLNRLSDLLYLLARVYEKKPRKLK